jgi:hypothetical protein
MEIQSEETIRNFASVAKHFGIIVREYCEKPASPKLHELEIHIPRQLARFKRLGMKGEDPIEFLHHVDKDMDYLLRGIPNWGVREQKKKQRREQGEVKEVAEALAYVRETTKRCVGQKSQEAKRARVETAKGEATLKYEKVINNANK